MRGSISAASTVAKRVSMSAHRIFSGDNQHNHKSSFEESLPHRKRSMSNLTNNIRVINTGNGNECLFKIKFNQIGLRDVFHVIGSVFHVTAVFLQGCYWSKFPWGEGSMCLGTIVEKNCKFKKSSNDWKLARNVYWAGILAIVTMVVLCFSVVLHMVTLSTYSQNRISFIWFVRVLLFMGMILGTASPLIYASVWPGVLPPNIYTSKAGLDWKPYWYQIIGFIVPTCLGLTITFYHLAKLDKIRIVQQGKLGTGWGIMDGIKQSLNSIYLTTGMKLNKHGNIQNALDKNYIKNDHLRSQKE